MIETRDLHKRFGDRVALAGLTIHVPAGEVYCLLGPNGAGKTTTIALLAGFQRPDGGIVRLAGADVAQDPSAARRRAAFVPELVALYPNLSGLENLQYFAGLALDRRLSRAEAVSHLTAMGLDAEAVDRRAAHYSKGMRQKVVLALALAKEAQALLFDEPTSGLDPSASADFALQVRGLAERGAAVLMATHDLSVALDAGNRIGILVGGHLVEECAVDQLTPATLTQLYHERVAAGHEHAVRTAP